MLKLNLRHQLFLVLLAGNVLLTLALLSGIGWYFSRSFGDYLNEVEQQRLRPLTIGLANEYREHGEHWQWLAHRHDRWSALLAKYLGDSQQLPPELARPIGPPPGAGFPEPPPFGQRPPPTPRSAPDRRLEGVPFYAERMLLRDADGELVMGRRGDVTASTNWLPITLAGHTIAELGITHQLRVNSELDRLFVERVWRQSIWIGAGIVLLSAVLAFPFARRLTRPIAVLQESMQQLAAGRYDGPPPLPVRGHDELARLAFSFNLLTETLRHHQRARRQWLADIAHELRTPVTVIRGELEALQDGVRPLNDSAVHLLQAKILRLSRLIDDLHDLSLSDLGALSYRRTPLTLKPFLDELLDEAREELNAHHLHAEFIADVDDDCAVFADEDRLAQLFHNLLSNSLRYTEAGGHLRISLSRRGDTLRLDWEDSAPGVSDADLPRLFERLYRGEQSRNRQSGGSGLGLAICQAIVSAHGGRIWAEHSVLGGLAVRIELPLYRT